MAKPVDRLYIPKPELLLDRTLCSGLTRLPSGLKRACKAPLLLVLNHYSHRTR